MTGEVSLREQVLREVLRYGSTQRGVSVRDLLSTGASQREIRTVLRALEVEQLADSRVVSGTRRWVRNWKLDP